MSILSDLLGVYRRLEAVEAACNRCSLPTPGEWGDHSRKVNDIAYRVGKLEASSIADGVSIPRILERIGKLEAAEPKVGPDVLIELLKRLDALEASVRVAGLNIAMMTPSGLTRCPNCGWTR